jgi:hypothetical protein
MGMKIVLYLLLLGAMNERIDQLVAHTQVKNDEIMVAILLTPGTCAKCFIEPMEILRVLQENRGPIMLKVIAIVRCDREIELKAWVKEVKWQYYYWMDEGDMRKEMGLKPEIIMAIYDFKSNKMIEFKRDNPGGNISKAAEFIKGLQP